MLPQRDLGATGKKVPILGFPGAALAVFRESDQDKVNEHVKRAFEAGVTYYDIAPSYGRAQYRLGPALAPYRRECFLACKTAVRDKAGAAAELEESLRALQTDYFDLFQLHAMTTEEDFEQAMGTGGALEAVKEAKAAGKVRNIGFSAHDETTAVRLIETGEFDTVMFPFNFISFNMAGVGHKVLEAANKQNMGIIAIKCLARCRLTPDQAAEDNPFSGGSNRKREFPIAFHKDYMTWYQPEDNPTRAEQLWRFTLSLPGLTAAIAPGNIDIFFNMALELAKLGDPREINALLAGTDEATALQSHYTGMQLTPIFHEFDKSGKFVTMAGPTGPSSSA